MGNCPQNRDKKILININSNPIDRDHQDYTGVTCAGYHGCYRTICLKNLDKSVIIRSRAVFEIVVTDMEVLDN